MAPKEQELRLTSALHVRTRMHTGHVKYEDDETLKDEMEKTVEG